MITQKPDIYQHLSLLRLVELIAHSSDKKALDELHNNRRIFHYYTDSKPLRLVEFADRLRHSKQVRRWCAGDGQIVENAYDLTISKFSNLNNFENKVPHLKLKGPNCLYYYESFLRYAARKTDHGKYHSEEMEKQVCGLFQNCVIRQFRLSCMQCCREKNQLTKRYLWKLDGHVISVILPVDIPGNQCSHWLAEQVPDANPSRPGESVRIQKIVDEHITRRKLLSLDNMQRDEIASKQESPVPEIEKELTISGLADVVADEKARNIKSQRDSIQCLGKDKLQKLIRSIFENLSWGRYKVLETADNFGISRAALSRFAGNHWLKQDTEDSDSPVPDLWYNTAQVLAGHPVFVSVARQSGVLPRVRQVLSSGALNKNGSIK